jgi:hypothetical protein
MIGTGLIATPIANVNTSPIPCATWAQSHEGGIRRCARQHTEHPDLYGRRSLELDPAAAPNGGSARVILAFLGYSG